MLERAVRWLLAPIALALAVIGLTASPSGAITGPNLQPDTTHTYVGLIAFYDADGNFVHRCSGTLLSDQVFLTAGHCVTLDDEGTLATTARIWFEQDAGADYNPVTGAPATSGYPVTGGVLVDTFYENDFRGLTIPQTNDVGLVILDPGALAAAYPALAAAAQYADLAAPGTSQTLGTGPDAVVDVSGYGVSAQKGKNGVNVVSYRSRLGGSTFIININTHNRYDGGYNLQLASNFGDGRVGTCFGDSGGPTFDNTNSNLIVADTSFGNNNCTGHGGVYRLDEPDDQAFLAGFGIHP